MGECLAVDSVAFDVLFLRVLSIFFYFYLCLLFWQDIDMP